MKILNVCFIGMSLNFYLVVFYFLFFYFFTWKFIKQKHDFKPNLNPIFWCQGNSFLWPKISVTRIRKKWDIYLLGFFNDSVFGFNLYLCFAIFMENVAYICWPDVIILACFTIRAGEKPVDNHKTSLWF